MPLPVSRIADTLSGGGEMGARIRAFDWSKTPVGPVDQWPQSLRTAVSILLASGYPMYIAWGAEYVQFYNDAYRPVLGASKHPQALGQSTFDCFPEVWDDIIRPMFERVRTLGEATSYHDYLFPLHRYGYTEECYFDFSYSAVRDETGGVGGVFVTCSETTGRVLGERRLATLREIGSAAGTARSAEEACRQAAEAMTANPHDIPFALLYLGKADERQAKLAAHVGLPADHPARVAAIELGDAAGPWQLSEVIGHGRAVLLKDLAARYGPVTAGAWPEPVTSALVLPITQTGQPADRQVAGALVAAISPRRALDDEYRGFLELVAGQVGGAIANARAYQAAVDRADALMELDRAKTAFFSNISHEFRTPLTLSLGPLEELLAESEALSEPDDRHQPATRDRLQMVYRNNLRLLRLVNTLLEFSRLEAGRIEASYEPVDLAALTADLASAFRSAIERAGLDLVVDAPPLGEPVYVDREMWERIVLNLLSNAFKFTFSGTITVSVRSSNGSAIVTVADSGVGIPPDERDRIFERFHRVRSTRSRTHEGTGIGLALVQELVRLHGGTISVESEVARGSTFTLKIPFGTAHLPAERIAQAQPATTQGKQSAAFVEEALRWLPLTDDEVPDISGTETPLVEKAGDQPGPNRAAGARVLLADDNRDMREYLTRLLSRYFIVESAADGAEALELARRTPPDLVITDVMMPGVDGFQLLQALRAAPATAAVPVIMLSARAGEEHTIEGLEAGADDYLTKPFAARELVARVRANLEMARARSVAADNASRYEAARAAQERALEILLAITRHLHSNAELGAFLGDLTTTVAGLVQARRVVFWRVDPLRNLLSAQPPAHGFSADIIKTMQDVPCQPDGNSIADRIVYGDLVFSAPDLNEPTVAPYRRWIDAMGIRDVIATAWRAGDRRLGMLGAYDSMRPGGFADEDTWVLRVAALAAGLVWQQKMAERALDELRAHEAEQLRAEVSRMSELESIKSDFLKLASHELRSPLTILRGYLDMIVDGTLGEPQPGVRPVYPILLNKVDEMNRLVNQMLETSRLEDNRMVFNVGELDLREVVRQCVETIQPLRSNSHAFDVTLPEAAVSVVGDRERLAMAVANLIENAVKYSPTGGRITVRCFVDRGLQTAAVQVADQGIGIDREDLPKLFARFGRIVNPDNSHIPGAGLGLYLSREIARMHGGDITISSVRRVGTTSTLALPLAENSPLRPGQRALVSPEDSRRPPDRQLPAALF